MKHFGAEVSEFRRFRKGDDFDAMAAGKNARIGGQHAVNVRPDLDLFRADARAHDRRREIGTAAPQSGGDAFSGGPDEPSHPAPSFASEPRHGFCEPPIGLGKQRPSLSMAMV